MAPEFVTGASMGMGLARGAAVRPGVAACRVSPVLVGRAEHLAALDAALATAGRGEPAAVLLGGETGVGKTRLVTEFARRVDAPARVVIGGCPKLGAAGLSYAPFTAVLRQLIPEFGTAAVRALAGRAPSELGRLLPELGDVVSQPDEAYPGAAHARLFEQLIGLLGRLTVAGPVALIIEDAHWADRSSRDLLTFLVGSLAVLPGLLVVVTFRSDELTRTHPLRPMLAGLSRISWVERTELQRLTREDAAALMAAILAHEPAAAEADAVFAGSEGNPLIVEQLLGCESAVPASLRDLVLAGLLRLPEETREALRVAALAGPRVARTLLAQVSGLAADDLAQVLRPAIAAGTLVADGDAYQFRHALTQEVMLEDLLPEDHGRLHARYAEAITADPALVPPGRAPASLAYHWYCAYELAEALTCAWRAAAEAARALAHSEQLDMLARVLELWDRVPDAAERIGAGRVQVLEHAAAAAELSGQPERGVAFATAARQDADAAR